MGRRSDTHFVDVFRDMRIECHLQRLGILDIRRTISFLHNDNPFFSRKDFG